MVLCYYVFVSQFQFTLPRDFSLPPLHTSRIDRMTLYLHYNSAWFRPTTTHEYPVLFHLHLLSSSPVLPTLHPHSPLTQSQYLQHNHSIYNTIQSFPFTGTHTPPHLFPPSPLPHQPTIPYINRTPSAVDVGIPSQYP